MRIVKNRTVNDRKGIIGGSQVASLLGLEHAFSTPYEVWKAFTGNDDDRQETEAMMAGHAMESGIAMLYEWKYGVELKELAPDEAWQHDIYDWAICHPDRIIDEHTAVEIKLVSSENSYAWGEEFTSQIPDYYATQVIWYMAVNEKINKVVVLRFTNNRLYVYEVFRQGNEDLIEWCLDEARKKVELMKSGWVPERTSLDEVYSFRRIKGFSEPIEEVALPFEIKMIADEYLKASNAEKEAKERKEKATMKMAELIGERKAITVGTRKPVSWVSYTKDVVDGQKLKSKYPEIYKECIKPSYTTYLKFNVKAEDVKFTDEEQAMIEQINKQNVGIEPEKKSQEESNNG